MIIDIPDSNEIRDKHQSFVEMILFQEYKGKERKELSIKEIMTYDNTKLKNTTFIFISKYEHKDQYFQIKVNKLRGENKNEVMISIIDNSH